MSKTNAELEREIEALKNQLDRLKAAVGQMLETCQNGATPILGVEIVYILDEWANGAN